MPHHFFLETPAGDRLVVVADSAAQAALRAASAGYPPGAREPYRVDARALRPYVGAFRLIGECSEAAGGSR